MLSSYAPQTTSQTESRLLQPALAHVLLPPSTGKEVVEAAKNEPRWHWIAKQMLHAWNEGMATVQSAKPQAELKGLTPILEAAGSSDSDKPESTREVIGRSELLAPARKS